ncbi:MAG: sigma-70 family RNA polymerase sigma factor [Lachnospiraceae bacterium]|nr:sigma-70 family RNA polymerase sigma factor [Lachnospiraceae bacterium]
MTKEQASKLLSENLTAIYGFAFARLYDKDKVDDLTSEIVCEILSSVKNLEKEEAFWGFAWRIAENTFRKFIKREELRGRAEIYGNEEFVGNYIPAREETYLEEEEQDEQTYLLRRELSLLSKTHREVCVAYYVDNKSCGEIATEQNISLEMVKYHLFKTRKLLKEGIGMTRKLGEKSYNPGTFRLDFWGDWNYYNDLFRRKLPGAIMLAAYYTPLSMEELSMELGVAVPYLEEELEILETAEVLTRVGNKYQTNLVIITNEFEKEFVKNTALVYGSVAAQVYEKAVALLPEFKALDFAGNQFDDNRLLFTLLNIVMVNAYNMTKAKSPLGKMPKLALGGNGWIFGCDNDYVNYHFEGITMETWNKAGSAWFSAENYSAIRDCQRYSHNNFMERVEAMCAAVLGDKADRENVTLPELVEQGFVTCKDGVLSANFPVFTAEVYKKVQELVAPLTEVVCDCMLMISDKAEKRLTEHAPAAVKNQCGDVAKIHYRLDVAAFLMEQLIEDKKLIVPAEQTPLCVWGVCVR